MKISIVIPTRERATYLRQSLQTALAIDDPDIEIIVSDNESLDDTAAIVTEVTDPRLRYTRTGRRVSMRQNYEHALNHVTGDYVIYIGDDDGMLPGQFPFLRRILERDAPDVLSWTFATYGWPADDPRAKTGTIRYEHRRAYGTVRTLDPAALAASLLACRLEELDPMPAIYHGCMSRAYVERLRAPAGHVFGSSSPDIYMSYRSILTGGRLLHADHMFTVNAFSPASTGRAHFAYDSSDARAEPGRRFISENAIDPIQDAVPNALSVSVALFAALETIRTTLPKSASQQPDFVAWYRYILGSARENDTELKSTLDRILSEYAARTGTGQQLNDSRKTVSARRPFAERLRAKWRHIQNKLYDFRISAAVDGRNDLWSATTMTDRLLGQDYGKMLDGTLGRQTAWSSLRRRAKSR